MKNALVLRLPNNREPFMEWLSDLDPKARAIVRAYIDRVAAGGGRKSVKALGSGIFEIKIDLGPGYRIYFGQDGLHLIILLAGGNKRSQFRDIALAKEYWSAYVQKQ